ncbi:MAG: YHS domain-containing protein, partial [Planctomycetota bacterium]|nr:YHS domain-containing protein [Planctomycetota bacterium]
MHTGEYEKRETEMMSRRIPLALPWLLLGTVTLAIIWDQVRTRDVEYVGSAKENVSHQEDENNNSTSVDPICSMEVRKGASDSVVFERRHYYFCSDYCVDEFKKNPRQYVSESTNRPPPDEHTMRGIPTWMAQLGVGFVILISFGLFESLPVPLKRKRGKESVLPILQNSKSGHGVSAPRSGALTDDTTARFELTAWAPLRRLLQWQYLRSTVQVFFAAAFLVIIAAGLFGNQNPAMNVAPLLTWTIWWVGLVFLVLFLGKAWCYVCPWDAIATWMEKLRFSGARKDGLGLQLEWPKSMRNIWPAVSLFVLLTWIELGAGITLIPRATSYVALAILGMAIVSAFLFERKAFCRYACLVGRISGLYSLFSSLELRTRDPQACTSCKTSDCYKGNDNGDGCPTFEFPRTMELNTYCILCTECMKTCPHDNIGINLRPWGSDLVGQGKPRTDEAFLSLVLLSMTGFHGLTMTPKWTKWNESVQAALGLSQWFTFTLL